MFKILKFLFLKVKKVKISDEPEVYYEFRSIKDILENCFQREDIYSKLLFEIENQNYSTPNNSENFRNIKAFLSNNFHFSVKPILFTLMSDESTDGSWKTKDKHPIFLHLANVKEDFILSNENRFLVSFIDIVEKKSKESQKNFNLRKISIFQKCYQIILDEIKDQHKKKVII